MAGLALRFPLLRGVQGSEDLDERALEFAQGGAAKQASKAGRGGSGAEVSWLVAAEAEKLPQ